MLLTVLDANGVSQKIITKGQETIVDHSGTIAVTNVAQTAIPANAFRSGYLIQNTSVENIIVSDGVTGSTFVIAPLAYFPPSNHAVNTNLIALTGTYGATFTAREW